MCGWRVYRQMPPQPSVAQSEMYVTVHLPGRHLRPEFGKDMLMKFSSSFVVPSAVAVLSTALLCAPAASQIPTGSAATIPPVTVDAPKQVAKPHVSERGANTTAPRRTASTARTSTASTPSYAPGSVMGRIASLEKVASSCNGGCASSFPSGKDPWVGCSESGGGTNYGPFSPTCRDTITINPTWIALKPRCSWEKTETRPTGFAAACRPATGLKSPNSSDQDVASPYRPLAFCFS